VIYHNGMAIIPFLSKQIIDETTMQQMCDRMLNDTLRDSWPEGGWIWNRDVVEEHIIIYRDGTELFWEQTQHKPSHIDSH